MVVFESVYSMSGTTADIGATCDVAQRYGAATFIDEVGHRRTHAPESHCMHHRAAGHQTAPLLALLGGAARWRRLGWACVCGHSRSRRGLCEQVHAVGLYGERGGGVAQRDGIEARLDVISGTLGKAYGILGGYIAGSRAMMDAVRSSSPPPAPPLFFLSAPLVS